MLQTVVYLSSIERIKIYKEGGCQFESKVEGIGWIVDNDSCKEWKEALTQAREAITDAIRNVETVDSLAQANLETLWARAMNQ